MRRITASVGRGGINKSPDVMIVQQLLQEFAIDIPPFRPAQVTGICDQQTLVLISEFQKRLVNMNLPTGKVDPESPTLYALNKMSGPGAPPPPGWADLESALSLLKTEATNFSIRFINDARVRQGYIRETEFVSKVITEEVATGRLTPFEGAQEANKIRNSIMESARINSSDLGQAQAEALKATGKSLQELEEYYAKRLFKKAFNTLSQVDKNRVWLEIVEASGRPRPAMNIKAARLAKVGRGLIFVSVAFAVYNVATAEDKGRQVVKEGATAGAGVLGGMAGGAVAGLACGPGAPVCVGVGIFVGGAIAALGADVTFDWLW